LVCRDCQMMCPPLAQSTGTAPLPAELRPFAERVLARFPGLVRALGDPQLPEAFELPREGESDVQVTDLGSHRVVRVSLARRRPGTVEGAAGNWQPGPLATSQSSHAAMGQVSLPIEATAALLPSSRHGCVGVEAERQQKCSPSTGANPSASCAASTEIVPAASVANSLVTASKRGTVEAYPNTIAPIPCNGEPAEKANLLPPCATTSNAACRAASCSRQTAPSLPPCREEALPDIQRDLPPTGRSEKRRLTLQLPMSRPGGMAAASSSGSLNDASSASSWSLAASPSLLQRRQQQGYKSKAISSISVSGHQAEEQQSAASQKRPTLRPSSGPVAEQKCRSPDRLASTVILELPSLSGSSPQPPRCFPGAFPHQRTVFFFDWDDTLCPTTWIRSVLKGLIDDRLEWDTKAVETMVDWRDMIPQWFRHKLPDDEFFRDTMKELQRKAINVIRLAQQYGVVCIVTNSLPGWVDMTIKKWLPALTPHIHGHGLECPPIKVLYSQQVQLRAPGDVPWVPEWDEFALMKRDAMSLALHDVAELYRMADEIDEMSSLPRPSWCSSSGARRVSNIVSVGNDEAEMMGAELAAFGYGNWRRCPRKGETQEPPQSPSHRPSGTPEQPPRWRSPRAFSAHRSDRHLPPGPRLTRVKYTDCPHVHHLTAHLEETAELLPYLAGVSDHTRIDLEARNTGASPNLGSQRPERGRSSLRRGCNILAQTV